MTFDNAAILSCYIQASLSLTPSLKGLSVCYMVWTNLSDGRCDKWRLIRLSCDRWRLWSDFVVTSGGSDQAML